MINKIILLLVCLFLTACNFDTSVPINPKTKNKIDDCLQKGLYAKVFRNMDSGGTYETNVTTLCYYPEEIQK